MTDNPSDLGNYVTADTRQRSGFVRTSELAAVAARQALSESTSIAMDSSVRTSSVFPARFTLGVSDQDQIHRYSDSPTIYGCSTRGSDSGDGFAYKHETVLRAVENGVGIGCAMTSGCAEWLTRSRSSTCRLTGSRVWRM